MSVVSMPTVAWVVATAVVAAVMGGQGGALAATARRGWGALTRWRSQYVALMAKGEALQREKDNSSEARHGWYTIATTSWWGKAQNWVAVLRDENVKRLIAETFRRMSFPKLFLYLMCTVVSSWITIRRAGLLAQVFDIVLPAATHAVSTAVSPATTPALDPAAVDGMWTAAMWAMAWYVCLFVLEEAMDLALHFLNDDMRTSLERRVRMTFFRAILDQDIAYLDSVKHGDLQRYMQDAPFAIFEAAFVPVRLLRYTFTFAAALYSMFAIDWKLAIAAWVLRLPMTLNFLAYTQRAHQLHWRLVEDVSSRQSASVSEALSNVRLVKLCTAEDVEVKKYGRLLSEGQEQASILRVMDILTSRLESLARTLFEVGTLAVGVLRILDGKATLGQFNAFRTYQHSCTSSFESLVNEATRLKSAARRSEAFFDVVDRIPQHAAATMAAIKETGTEAAPGIPAAHAADVVTGVKVGSAAHAMRHAELQALQAGGAADHGDEEDAAQPPMGCSPSTTPLLPLMVGADGRGAASTAIAFNGVAFTYPKIKGNSDEPKSALTEVNLTVKAGQTVALVGMSGGGKSTIFRLLTRLYDVTAGSITVGGRDVRAWDIHALRRQFGVVEQEPPLLNQSVADNICYGLDPEAPNYPTTEAIHAAARTAHIHDVITSFPDGYATLVGDKGVRLSCGQKQRLAIARAIVRNPAILLLDEITASLDSESEAAVKAGIDAAMVGRTVLIIAHRLHTVQHAHCIHVLHNGCCVEQGSHSDLMRQGGRYAAMVRQQLFDDMGVTSSGAATAIRASINGEDAPDMAISPRLWSSVDAAAPTASTGPESPVAAPSDAVVAGCDGSEAVGEEARASEAGMDCGAGSHRTASSPPMGMAGDAAPLTTASPAPLLEAA